MCWELSHVSIFENITASACVAKSATCPFLTACHVNKPRDGQSFAIQWVVTCHSQGYNKQKHVHTPPNLETPYQWWLVRQPSPSSVACDTVPPSMKTFFTLFRSSMRGTPFGVDNVPVSTLLWWFLNYCVLKWNLNKIWIWNFRSVYPKIQFWTRTSKIWEKYHTKLKSSGKGML